MRRMRGKHFEEVVFFLHQDQERFYLCVGWKSYHYQRVLLQFSKNVLESPPPSWRGCCAQTPLQRRREDPFRCSTEGKLIKANERARAPTEGKLLPSCWKIKHIFFTTSAHPHHFTLTGRNFCRRSISQMRVKLFFPQPATTPPSPLWSECFNSAPRVEKVFRPTSPQESRDGDTRLGPAKPGKRRGWKLNLKQGQC